MIRETEKEEVTEVTGVMDRDPAMVRVPEMVRKAGDDRSHRSGTNDVATSDGTSSAAPVLDPVLEYLHT